MNISVFGVGYVGFTSCCCMASEGHKVVGVDLDPLKVAQINNGEVPFSEPELSVLLAHARHLGLLDATTDAKKALADADVALVCVGTPSSNDGSHNMKYITNVTQTLAKAVAALDSKGDKPLCVVYRSTVQPGTLRGMISTIFREHLGECWRDSIRLVFNPEFLREGKAVADYFSPARIIIGTEDGTACDALTTLYENIDAPTYSTRFEEAEFIKFVDNTWHATKVAFANEIGRVCEALDLRADKVHELFVADDKLNLSAYYTRPGGPFGGSCLPKDSRALVQLAEKNDVALPLITSLSESNLGHLEFLIKLISTKVTPTARILLNGLTFKQDTDDLRESPFLKLASILAGKHCNFKVYDVNINRDLLHGSNLSELMQVLPNYSDLLITVDEASNEAWDLIINSSVEMDVELQYNAKLNIFDFNYIEKSERDLR